MRAASAAKTPIAIKKEMASFSFADICNGQMSSAGSKASTRSDNAVQARARLALRCNYGRDQIPT